MAGGLPIGLQCGPSVDFVAASTTYGAAVASSASANTKGSYVELIAATAIDAAWMQVNLRPVSASRSYLVDIAVGGAGAEVDVIPYLLLVAPASAQTRQTSIMIPVCVPAGSRLAARCQSSTGSATCNVSVTLFADSLGSAAYGQSPIITYNIASSTSLAGNTVDPGGSANTKGSYSQLTASAGYDIKGFFLSVGPGNNSTSSTTTPLWGLDIAVGGAGSEVVILPDQIIQAPTSSAAVVNSHPTTLGYFPIPIPKGARIAARAQCNVTTATGRVLGVVFHGVT